MKIWMKDGKFVDITAEQKETLDAKQLAEYTNDKNEHQKAELIASFDTKMDEKTKGFLKQDEIDKIKSDFEALIKGMPTEALATYVATIEGLKTDTKAALDLATEVKEIAATIGAEVKASLEGIKVPDVRRKTGRKSHIEELIKNAFLSVEFDSFQKRGFVGASSKMILGQEGDKIQLKQLGAAQGDAEANVAKATVDTSSHTGTVMISEVSDIVRDDTPTRITHVRDLLNVSMTNQAQIVAGQVYDFTDALTLGAVMLAENGQAPESVFKSKENTWGLKRIANSMRLSKREIAVNGLQWVMDKVLAKLPDATLYVEDVQLLFGDGLGDNVRGLTLEARDFNLTPNTYTSGAFASVASYDTAAQSLLTFTAVHGITNGSNLIIANSTNYNATYEAVIVVNETQVIIDAAYVAEATGAWTGSSTSPFYQTITNAQEYDTLAVSDAKLEAGEYESTGYVCHPSQGTQMGLLKDTQGNYLNITKDARGRIASVNGKPVAYTTAMTYGKWLNGDFSRNGVELREFTPLNIQFAEDVESVKKNEIVIVIQEEIIFPVYNPKWFIFGKFSTAKTQLLKPVVV